MSVLGPNVTRNQLDQHVAMPERPPLQLSSSKQRPDGSPEKRPFGIVPVCRAVGPHQRWSTQKPTVLGATARTSSVVPSWVVRCLAD